LEGADAHLEDRRFRVAKLDAPLAGATLLHLSDLAGPEAAARREALLWLLGLLLIGGIIPDEDIPALQQMGVSGIFGPGTNTEDIAKHIRKSMAEKGGREA
jgi:methylmalonyl-CoA mutase cobalamin-binding subunit